MPNSNGVADEFNEQLRLRALSASLGAFAVVGHQFYLHVTEITWKLLSDLEKLRIVT